jgi:hypothetical protein
MDRIIDLKAINGNFVSTAVSNGNCFSAARCCSMAVISTRS